MIKASKKFIKTDKFYDLKTADGKDCTGYEVIFNIILKFKEKYGFIIHILNQDSKDNIEVCFKGDYWLIFKKYSNDWEYELINGKDDLHDFTEKFNFLRELIK
jgi:hypothetical protein